MSGVADPPRRLGLLFSPQQSTWFAPMTAHPGPIAGALMSDLHRSCRGECRGTGETSEGNDLRGDNSAMATNKLLRRYGRSARDFALGLGVFAGAAMAGVASPGCLFSTAAHARRFEEEPFPPADERVQRCPDSGPNHCAGLEQRPSTHGIRHAGDRVRDAIRLEPLVCPSCPPRSRFGPPAWLIASGIELT